MTRAFHVTTAEAMRSGDAVGVDWRRVTPAKFRRALGEEMLSVASTRRTTRCATTRCTRRAFAWRHPREGSRPDEPRLPRA